jgi:type I restriction enzyme, S subunit
MARKSIYPPSVTPGIPRLGRKPEGWVETTFGEVLQVVQRRAEVADDSEYQLVNAKRSRGGVVARERLLGRQVLTKTQFLVRTDDFLISKRQIIHGACGIVPASLDGALVSNEYATLRVRDQLLLDYLRYFIHTVYFQQTCLYASVGVDVEKMIFRLGDWLKYKVHLPPVPEQRKIAAVLGAWDEAIALTERRIAAGQRRKQGLMQRLLTGQVRFPEFAQESWAQMQLGSLGHCIRGVSYSPQEDLRMNDSADTVRLLRANNIYGSRINTDDIQFVVSDRCKSTQYLNFGDIAICMASGSKEVVGKAAMFRMDDGFAYTVGAFCAIFRVPDGASGDFVGHYFQSQQYRKELAQLTAGSSINNLKPSDIEGIRFSMPANPVETAKVADVLAACDREIDLLTRKRDALQRQKRGLMQQLLTGRVRVKV